MKLIYPLNYSDKKRVPKMTCVRLTYRYHQVEAKGKIGELIDVSTDDDGEVTVRVSFGQGVKLFGLDEVELYTRCPFHQIQMPRIMGNEYVCPECGRSEEHDLTETKQNRGIENFA